jgi:hypothetical protein
MQNMIDNLINGNLTDAKKQAKRHTQNNILLYLFSMGYSKRECAAIAGYLKGEIAFDVYCKETENCFK